MLAVIFLCSSNINKFPYSDIATFCKARRIHFEPIPSDGQATIRPSSAITTATAKPIRRFIAPDRMRVNPSVWAYRASAGASAGQIIIVQWGQNGDFPAPGDYDGDGKYDFVVQRNAGGGAANFFLKQLTAGITAVQWGTPTDVIVPGYYDNDCKTDIAVVRSGGIYNWYIRNSTNGALQAYQFGASATDYFTQGDYDGDGATDVAVWRPSATAGQTSFYWRRSIDGALGVQQWGQNGDLPVARFNSH